MCRCSWFSQFDAKIFCTVLHAIPFLLFRQSSWKGFWNKFCKSGPLIGNPFLFLLWFLGLICLKIETQLSFLILMIMIHNTRVIANIIANWYHFILHKNLLNVLVFPTKQVISCTLTEFLSRHFWTNFVKTTLYWFHFHEIFFKWEKKLFFQWN